MDAQSYIRAHADDLIENLSMLIRIPSVEGPAEPDAPFGRAVASCLQQALALCDRLGFRTENMDNRVGWCEYGEGEQMIAILGHLDVVPAGSGWQEAEPFGGEVKNGRIYGRGAMDDKGPLIAALYALAALKDTGFRPSRRIRILFGTNEETGCQDMAWYLAHGGETPVMGFTPDGEYPVIHGEKGIISCTYFRPLRQSGAWRLLHLSGGSADNVVPDYACAELSCPAGAAVSIDIPQVTVIPTEYGLQIDAAGISAHGSTPEQGENAIGRLALALTQLPLEGDLADCIAFIADRIGMETRGESLGLAMRDTPSGDLTVNLGIARGDENGIALSFSVRYPVTKAHEQVQPRLARAFCLGGFTENAYTHTPALYLPPECELIRTLLQVYEQQTGEKAPPKCIGGGTYAKSMPGLVAFGPIFPGDEAREHQPDEYMEIERLLQNAEMFAAAIRELAR